MYKLGTDKEESDEYLRYFNQEKSVKRKRQTPVSPTGSHRWLGHLNHDVLIVG